MLNLTSHSFNPKDEPTLQQLEIHLQHLSQDKKAAIAMTAIYEATEPSAVDFDHVCDCCPKFNKAIALLQNLSYSGLGVDKREDTVGELKKSQKVDL